MPCRTRKSTTLSVSVSPLLPLPATRSILPIPTEFVRDPTKKSHAKKQPPGHIPRPRNAFILFRCAFVHQKKAADVETDHRNISRIAGKIWKEMTKDEKLPWIELAEDEKMKHSKAYPHYRPRVSRNPRTLVAEDDSLPSGRRRGMVLEKSVDSVPNWSNTLPSPDIPLDSLDFFSCNDLQHAAPGASSEGDRSTTSLLDHLTHLSNDVGSVHEESDQLLALRTLSQDDPLALVDLATMFGESESDLSSDSSSSNGSSNYRMSTTLMEEPRFQNPCSEFITFDHLAFEVGYPEDDNSKPFLPSASRGVGKSYYDDGTLDGWQF